MNEPHVKTLTYKVVPAADVDYDRAQPIEFETTEFSAVVNSVEAVFYMKLHYSSKSEARVVVEEYLRAWEMVVGLDIQPGDLIFEFKHADIVDLAPDKANSNVLNVHSISQAQVVDNIALHVSRGELPRPSLTFKVSPDVETMYNRYKGYKEGKEGLLSMAYLCLTIIEAISQGRGNAAKRYNISKKVLDRLGTLVSKKGGPDEARKMPKNGSYEPLSSIEREWVEKAIKLLIKRVGEHDSEAETQLQQITLDMLPTV